MNDFLVALGLLFVIEGIMFAAFPMMARRAMTMIAATPDAALRRTGIISATLGLGLVWLVRG